MKKSLVIAGLLVLVLGVSSCTHRLTDFTVISTKNVPLGNENVTLQKSDKRVKGVDKSHMILFIPTGSPNMKEAIDKAIEQYPGAVGLADGVIKSKFWWALLYGQNSYIVEGTPLYEADVKGAGVPADNTESGDVAIFFHEVKDGETLSSIANAYGVKVANIIKWNQLSSDSVAKGTKLKIYVR